MNRKLSHKQDLFINHYLENGGNATKAAINAGYKGSNDTLRAIARENLTKPHICAEIDKVRQSIKDQSIITAQVKREKLWQVAQYNSEVIRIKRNGLEIEAMRNPTATISAITELNKMDGDYAPQKVASQGEMKIYLDQDDLALAGK
jgi:phage terminase small subunit